MKKNKRLSIIIIISLVLLVGVFALLPMILFKNNEKKLLNAAKSYYEINTKELPSGERVKTVYLSDLYKKAFLKEDLYIPYTHKLCSLKDSWVKVKNENNEYKYYVYLNCGVFKSSTDHKGPTIKLNGSKEITINKGEDFKDPGVKSVKDAVDGKISIDTVEVKSNVNTKKAGIYTISYTASDKLNNKTTVKRNVTVVTKIANNTKELLGENTNFKGEPDNNYVRLSNMLFRIYGIDSDNNVILVSDENISYISYSSLDKWLDYYYNHLTKETQKMIVSKKYCNETLEANNLKTTECNSYTKSKKVYIPSIDMLNKAQSEEGNFIKQEVITWVANRQSNERGYATPGAYQRVNQYIDYDLDINLNIRPMITIKGDGLIVSGDGTITNPYSMGEQKTAKSGTSINKRYTGEYVSINGKTYRIIEVEKDGTTKIISDYTLNDVECTASSDSKTITYNPKKTTSVAYFINNKAIAYVEADNFVNHKIKVPTYKDKIVYGKEIETKEYTVKLSAPNMFEMFSATKKGMRPYWLINSSNEERKTGIVGNEVPIVEVINRSRTANIRVVAYLNEKTTIYGGDGTLDNPYKIK